MASSPENLFNQISGFIFNLVIIIAVMSLARRKKKGTSAPGNSILEQIQQAINKTTSSKQNQETPTPAVQKASVPQPAASQTSASFSPSGLSPLKTMLQGLPLMIPAPPSKLDKRQRYLQVALNSTLDEARSIISRLPRSERILIEAGTPLIKIYGAEAIRTVRAAAWPGAYIVADAKTADLADREVAMAAQAGANAITCLGVAPIETIDRFIASCRQYGIDSMVDMMNVERAYLILKKLKQLPEVVILHRGVDESELSKEKQIPFYQIKQIKGSYNMMVAVAGGDDIREVQRAVFNNADIVVVWKDFYRSTEETAGLAGLFLKEIK